MKKFRYIFILLLLTGISCENLLEEPVYDFRTDETVFLTEGSTNAVLEGLFKGIQEYNYYSAHYHQLLGFNSALTTRRQGGETDIAKLQQNPVHVWIEKLYAAIYSNVAQANIILETADSTSADMNIRNARGIAYFFRGMHYFNLVRLWGSVPLSLSIPEKVEDTYIPRAETIDMVYDQIISDLTNAYQNLNSVQADPKAPKQMAAYALLAKVYAQLGSMCEDKDAFGLQSGKDASEYWTLARDYADSVITSGAYSLAPDFTELFSLNNEFTNEAIFEIGFSNVAEGVGCAFTHMYVPQVSGWSSNGTGGWGRVVVTREMWDTMVAVTGGVDARLATNLITEYTRTDEKTVVSYPALGKGTADVYLPFPSIQKYKDPNGIGNNTHANNFIYLRYADILLTFAEASNELEGPTARTIDPLNELLRRSRESGTGSSIPAEVFVGQYTSKEAFRARIMAERMVELVGEVHEWYDARRRGRAYFKTILENHNARLDQAADEGIFNSKWDYYFADDDYSVRRNLFLPIPQAEINANEAIDISDQNFGY